jgi:PHP family Zn ribbon phosphoesterase
MLISGIVVVLHIQNNRVMRAIEDYIACYCLNAKCSNSIYKYKTTAITFLSLERSLMSQTRCTKCGSILKSKIDLEIEEQIRELLAC